jgi:hypothetical protein
VAPPSATIRIAGAGGRKPASSHRDALGISLAAENRVKEFFESVARQAEHRDARRLGAQIVKDLGAVYERRAPLTGRVRNAP